MQLLVLNLNKYERTYKRNINDIKCNTVNDCLLHGYNSNTNSNYCISGKMGYKLNLNKMKYKLLKKIEGMNWDVGELKEGFVHPYMDSLPIHNGNKIGGYTILAEPMVNLLKKHGYIENVKCTHWIKVCEEAQARIDEIKRLLKK